MHLDSLKKHIQKELDQYGSESGKGMNMTGKDPSKINDLVMSALGLEILCMLESPEKLAKVIKTVEKHAPKLMKSISAMGKDDGMSMHHDDSMRMNYSAYGNYGQPHETYNRQGVPGTGNNSYHHINPYGDDYELENRRGRRRSRYRNEYEDDMYDMEPEERHRSRRTGRYVRNEMEQDGDEEHSGRQGKDGQRKIGF